MNTNYLKMTWIRSLLESHNEDARSNYFLYSTMMDHELIRRSFWNNGRITRVPAHNIVPEILDLGSVEIKKPFFGKKDTSIDIEELIILVSIAKSIDANNILEFGTYDGRTTLNLVTTKPYTVHVTSIDLPSDWKGIHVLPIAEKMRNVHSLSNIGIAYRDSPYIDYITEIRADSALLSPGDLFGPYDLIFIDGCHDRRYVKSDTELALHVLAESGSIIWHDYGMISDVTEYLDEKAKYLDLFVIEGTRLAIYRRDK